MDEIIIADSSAVFVMELETQLAPEVSVRSCDNARDLLAMLEQKMPDLLVLNLSLPGCDGFELLRRITAMSEHPAVLATVDYVSDFVRSSLASMGIGYLMVKPCNIVSVAERIQEMLCFYADNPVPRDLLDVLMIPENLNGASYIRYAVPILMENPQLQLTKDLYPRIGARFGKNGQCVERSIRNAVHTTWKKHGGFIWQQYLDTAPDGRSHRPSNSQFFHMLLNMIRKVG